MKKPYRALIVDDERLARRGLASLLKDDGRIVIAGEADGAAAAAEAVERLHPDVIFLDIQMPGSSGFDVLEAVETKAKIIFVTAYDEFAIRAFEVNALDYLLKPVRPERLAQAIDRLDEGAFPSSSGRALEPDDRLFLMLGNRFRFLKVGSILAVQAAGDYTEIILADGSKGLTLKPMKEWERRLPERHFLRIHRSVLVNMDGIDRVEDWFHSSFRVYLKGLAEPFVISRRYAARIKSRLG